MDIRVQKTKKAIADAFLRMTGKKPIEKITVTDIVTEAQINKSTFYAHYRDIYDLMDALSNDAISSVVSGMHYLANMFEDPHAFFLDMYDALSICQNDNIQPFSSGNMKFSQQLSAALNAKAIEQGLQPDNYHYVGALLTFTINGIIALHKVKEPAINDEDLEKLANFFEKRRAVFIRSKKEPIDKFTPVYRFFYITIRCPYV